MFHPRVGPLARLFITVAVLAPSIAASYSTWLGLKAAGASEAVAYVPAGLIAIVGIVTITYGIETLINRWDEAHTE